MKLLTTSACCALFLFLTACSETPTKTAEKKSAETVQPPEPVTGNRALYQMFIAARSWAPDIQILGLSSIRVPDVKTEPGKAGAWQATFVSQSLGRARSYTYSVVEGEGNLHKGVFAGSEQGWSGPRGVNKPFLMAADKVDSDAAYQTALKKGADYAKKHPNLPMFYLLELNNRFPDPSWRIVWGESIGTSAFSIFVDASTGAYLETLR